MGSVKCAVLCEILCENQSHNFELTHLKKKGKKHFDSFVNFVLRYFCNATLQAWQTKLHVNFQLFHIGKHTLIHNTYTHMHAHTHTHTYTPTHPHIHTHTPIHTHPNPNTPTLVMSASLVVAGVLQLLGPLLGTASLQGRQSFSTVCW